MKTIEKSERKTVVLSVQLYKDSNWYLRFEEKENVEDWEEMAFLNTFLI